MGRYSCSQSDYWVSPQTEIEETPSNEISKNNMNRSSSLPADLIQHRRNKKNQVLLQGFVESDQDDIKRTKSLTDDDLDELKGCLDLGFGFSYDEIPELCNTLPALELCYSMSQKFIDDQQHKSYSSPENSPVGSESGSSPIANWKISSPGDHPEDVKARLKYWAQAVACTESNVLKGMKFLLGMDLPKFLEPNIERSREIMKDPIRSSGLAPIGLSTNYLYIYEKLNFDESLSIELRQVLSLSLHTFAEDLGQPVASKLYLSISATGANDALQDFHPWHLLLPYVSLLKTGRERPGYFPVWGIPVA
ncbi:hypothetical protein ACFE04_015740 [Oxalis oulophora]